MVDCRGHLLGRQHLSFSHWSGIAASPSRDPKFRKKLRFGFGFGKGVVEWPAVQPSHGKGTKNRSHEKILITKKMDGCVDFLWTAPVFCHQSQWFSRVLSFLISLRKVVCVRAEDINISGSLYRNKLKYANFRRKHMRLGCTCSKVTG